MSNCGCNPPGSSPPNTFTPTVSSPIGAGSPFGGNTHIARGACRPFCPSPPVSSAQLRAPYVPPWLATLTNNPFGKMIVAYGGALYTFQSKCTGPVFYDASTGAVSVQSPPYASSLPKETDYGYVALAVPSADTICRDGDTNCETEIRQQFAAQRIDDTDCGDLLLWNRPDCGQVPALQASDAQNQGRWDRATLKLLDDIDATCLADGDVTLMAFYPKTVNLPGGGTSTCRQPVRMKRLRFKASQWGTFNSDATGNADARIMIAKKVGGTTDPCMELEMTNITLAQLNTAINNPPAIWNWLPLPMITVYSGVPSALNTLTTDFLLAAIPATAKSLKVFIYCIIASPTGNNINYTIAVNGVFAQFGGTDDTSTSFQQPMGTQVDCPCLPGRGAVVNFTDSGGGPSGGTRILTLQVGLLAWN